MVKQKWHKMIDTSANMSADVAEILRGLSSHHPQPFPGNGFPSQLTEHEGYYQWYSVSLIIRVTLTVH